jgi:hypothetical protein
MSDLWLSAEHISAALTPMTEDAIYKRMRRNLAAANGTRALYERLAPSARGGGIGGARKEYNVSRIAQDFPRAISALELEKLQSPPPAADQVMVTQSEILERPAPPALPFLPAADQHAIAAIPERAQPLAEARARAIEPLRQFALHRGQTIHGIRIEKLADLVAAIARDSELFARHKSTLVDWRGIEALYPRFTPVAKGTLWNWWSWYRRGRTVRGAQLLPGIVALHDPPPATAGRSIFAEQFPSAAAFVLTKRLREGLSLAHVHDALRREWPRLSAADHQPGAALPGYNTLRRLLANPRCLPAHVRQLVELGPRKWRAEAAPCIRRERPAPGAWLVLDHRQHDVHLANRLFDFLPAFARYRIWKTLAMDWGSTLIAGWCFAPTPSSATINSALRLAFGQFGFWQNLYFDRGEDFKKVGRALSDELLGLLSGRTEVTQALPYNAKAKPIESWFRIFSARFDREWGAAYAGRAPQHRSEFCAIALKQHEAFLGGKRQDTPLPSDAEFIEQAVLRIAEHNATPQRRLGGRSPLEVFDAACPPETRTLPSPRLLDALFSVRETRTVGRGGTVRLDNLLYQPREEFIGALAAWQQQEVRIARDPYNLSEAVAFDPLTGAFLGELELQPLAPQSPHGRDPLTQDAIRANRRRTARLRREQQSYLLALSCAASAAGYRTERETRAARANLKPAILSAAPGASTRPRHAEPKPALAPAFVSDAASRDADQFGDFEFEEDPDAAAR